MKAFLKTSLERIKKGWNQLGCLGRGLFIIGSLVVLFYLIRCQSWFLSSSPWAYHFCLCHCSPRSEQALYPDNVEIVVSACRNPGGIVLSPDGRYMITRADEKNYLLDFMTNKQQQQMPDTFDTRLNYSDELFLTDTLMLFRSQHKDYSPQLIDVTDGTIINLTWLAYKKENDRIVLPPETIAKLKEANAVMLVIAANAVITLGDDPKQHPDKNYSFAYFLPGDKEYIQTIFAENGIDYQIVSSQRFSIDYFSQYSSRSGRFYYERRSIYSSDGQELATIKGSAPPFVIYGWAYDDSGIYLGLRGGYIFEGSWITPYIFDLPRPLIKLKVPEEYLTVTPPPLN